MATPNTLWVLLYLHKLWRMKAAMLKQENRIRVGVVDNVAVPVKLMIDDANQRQVAVLISDAIVAICWYPARHDDGG